MPRVATAVAPLAGLVEAVYDVPLGQVTSPFKILEQMVTLGVDIWSDVVSDLTGRMAQANAFVVCCRSNPGRAAIRVNLLRLPEPDVVPLPRVGADRLFEGQVFFAPPQVQVTDRGIVIRTFEDRGGGNFQTATQGEWVGGVPLGRQQDPDDLGFRADESHVDRVSRDAVGGVGDTGHVLQRRMPVGVSCPEDRQEEVSYGQV